MHRAIWVVFVVSLLLGFAPARGDSRGVRAEADCGPYVVANGDLLLVSPSGGEDTAALQCALDEAQGRTIHLAAGTFHTAQLVARGFEGRLVGAGIGATTITNVDRPLVVTAEDWNLAPPSATHPWPTLVAFVDGDFVVSDLAVAIRGAAPTTGWSAFGVHATALGHVISITGLHASATVERVSFLGEEAPEDFFGVNTINAIDVEGITGQAPESLAVALAVRDCTFRTLASGVPVANLVDSDVQIVKNRFSGLLDAAEIVDLTNTRYRFTANDVDVLGLAIDQFDACLGPNAQCGITGSTVSITGNRITGAPILFEGTWNEGDVCHVVGNTFDVPVGPAGDYDVVLREGTHDCLVNHAAVLDLGTSNRVVP